MFLRLQFARLLASVVAVGAVAPLAPGQVAPYGSGINPAGSLELTAGVPLIGFSFELSLRNPTVPNPLPGLAYLYLANQAAPGFPGGLVLPGLGLGSPGADGELLIAATAPNPFLTKGPAIYLGGASSGAKFSLAVPPNPSLAGVDVFAQGLLLTDNQGFLLGLTNGLRITLGAYTGPIPGVTQVPGLAVIQPGTFQRGSNAGSSVPYFSGSNEKPVHPVTISKPFWMGVTEVTQAQYQALMGANPSLFFGPDLPVERVNWGQARAYCSALTLQQAALGNVTPGYEYRLPTEAEWEYACRAGTTTEFNVGEGLFCNQARFAFSYHSDSSCLTGGTTTSVASFAPNAWGLYDMHGNVQEWCLDSTSFYPAGAVTDPFVTGGISRMVRGGGYSSISPFCRSAYRPSQLGSYTSQELGFRVVLAPILVP